MGSPTLGKAASIDSLLNEYIHAFDDSGELHVHLLPRTLLLMHRWYVPSAELAGKLLMIYPTWETHGASTRLRICYLMRYWIVTFPAEFNLDLGLIRITEEFRDVAARLGCEKHFELIDISTIPSHDWMRKLTQRKKQTKKGKASLLFDHLEPMELAEHLTFLEFKFTDAFLFKLCIHGLIHGCIHLNYKSKIQLTKKPQTNKQENSTRVKNVTKTSGFMFTQTNPDSDFSYISSPLTLPPNPVPFKNVCPFLSQIWSEMTELVSSSNNYSCYRKAFNECRGFKIPILGVHLKDLIAVHVVFPDWVGDSNKINLVKMHQFYMTFNELVSLQGAVAHVEPNMDLIHLLTLSLDRYYAEDKIYELSLLREPRNPKSQPTSPTTPTKPSAPLDWASGVTTKPDPSVINKHIWKVVNYDHDHDGSISQEDFENIAANFPFLDSFCVPVVAFSLDDDDVFEFPAVPPTGPALDTPSQPSITLMTGSAQRISVRLQRATITQATQTEPLWPELSWGGTENGSHTFPKMKYRTHRKASKSKGLACWEKKEVRTEDSGTSLRQDVSAVDGGPA
uniref:N-terminal Ras-GEF domain-containing protein n=1 Tax=Oryzias latipes TaxID=8090 RepID=A0A3B3I5H9_ORYLA